MENLKKMKALKELLAINGWLRITIWQIQNDKRWGVLIKYDKIIVTKRGEKVQNIKFLRNYESIIND